MSFVKNIGLVYTFVPFLASPSIIENKISFIISILLGSKKLSLKIKNLPKVSFQRDEFYLFLNLVGVLTYSIKYELSKNDLITLTFDYVNKFEIPLKQNTEEEKNLVELLYLCSRDGASFVTDENINLEKSRFKTLKIYKKNEKHIVETFSGIKFFLDSIHPGNTIDECFVNDMHSIQHSDNFTGKIVVDVGAECGDTPLYYASLGAKVFAFEPITDNFNSMLRNISLNEKLADNIIPINAAVGKDGILKFFQSPDSPTYGSSFVYNRYGNDGKTVNVKGLSFLKLLEEYNINEIELLKLDCKGCEIYLDKKFLAHVNSIKIEYMGQFTSSKLDDLKNVLEESGFSYEIYRSTPFSRLSNKLNGHIYAKKCEAHC